MLHVVRIGVVRLGVRLEGEGGACHFRQTPGPSTCIRRTAHHQAHRVCGQTRTGLSLTEVGQALGLGQQSSPSLSAASHVVAPRWLSNGRTVRLLGNVLLDPKPLVATGRIRLERGSPSPGRWRWLCLGWPCGSYWQRR